MPDLLQWFTTKSRNADELCADESAEYDLRVRPLDARFGFLDRAPGFLFVGRPHGRGSVGDRLEANLTECGGVGRSQGSDFQDFFLHVVDSEVYQGAVAHAEGFGPISSTSVPPCMMSRCSSRAWGQGLPFNVADWT